MTDSGQDDVFTYEDTDYSQDIFKELERKRKAKKDDNSTLSKLDRKNMLSIIMFLKDNRPANKTDIYSNISRNVNMADKMDALQRMGLICIHDTFEKNMSYIVLTDKGERVADIIQEMIDLIDNDNGQRPPEYALWRERNRDD